MLAARASAKGFLDAPAAAYAAGASLDPERDTTHILGVAPPPVDSAIGEHIGPYKLVERIGEGGFGVV